MATASAQSAVRRRHHQKSNTASMACAPAATARSTAAHVDDRSDERRESSPWSCSPTSQVACGPTSGSKYTANDPMDAAGAAALRRFTARLAARDPENTPRYRKERLRFRRPTIFVNDVRETLDGESLLSLDVL
jgi:hypothetical protein